MKNRGYIRDPALIYRKSFDIIESEADLETLPVPLREIARRLIHACGMVDICEQIRFSPDFVESAHAALRTGATIFADVEMVASGIARSRLPSANEVVCTLNDPRVADHAKNSGTTRSAAAVDFWDRRLEGAVAAIGNAPTALFHLMDKIENGGPRPAAILGFPVGFVGAAESKLALAECGAGVPFLTLLGRRGGSAMASAAVNALSASLKEPCR